MKRICSRQLEKIDMIQRSINQYRAMFLKANEETHKIRTALEEQFGHPSHGFAVDGQESRNVGVREVS